MAKILSKLRCMLVMLNDAFAHQTPQVLIPMYLPCVLKQLEYCVQAWSTSLRAMSGKAKDYNEQLQGLLPAYDNYRIL